MEMTITRALTELKLLDAKINKAISQAKFVDIYQNRKDLMLSSNETKDVFIKNANSSIQKIEDLIERRKKIKSAILISNASVVVSISGRTYSVIEAIERKNSILYEKNLLEQMRMQLTDCLHQVEQQKPKLEQGVAAMIQNNLEGDSKPSKEDYDAIAKPFLAANEFNMVDPCSIKTKIEQLDSNIDNFLGEVDFVLSESNAITKITI